MKIIIEIHGFTETRSNSLKNDIIEAVREIDLSDKIIGEIYLSYTFTCDKIDSKANYLKITGASKIELTKIFEVFDKHKINEKIIA